MRDTFERASAIARRDLLKAAGLAALSVGLLASRASAAGANSRHLWGVNLAGADFGDLPGKHGTEYLYPPREDIAYYAQLGFKLVRIPFKWERLQPAMNAPFAPAELDQLGGVVDHARRLGLTVVLDPHNYAKRRLDADGWKSEYLIGSSEVPLGAYTDFWARLADHFKSDEAVIFGLMNEPVKLSAEKWLEIANAAIRAIRAQAARNTIFVPGTDYTGAHSWFAAGNTAMAGVNDPADNFAIEVHQYFDTDSSGTKPAAVSGTIGSERIEDFQNWARARRLRAFLGEYNGGRDALSLRALMDLCDELNANSDVWIGSAAWAGGPRWPEEDMFNLEPYKDGRIREQTAIIQSRARPDLPQPSWAGASPALYADFVRGLSMNGASPRSLLRAATPALDRDDPNRLQTSAVLQNGAIPIDPGSATVVAHGELADLFSHPEFTIIVETRAIDPAAGSCNLLSSGVAGLLYSGNDGALKTDLGGGLSVTAVPAKRWQLKCRCALSVRRDTQEVAIAMTDAAPVSGRGLRPFFPNDGRQGHLPIAIGSTSAPARNGSICRIVGFDAFFSGDELAADVA